ncbi:hypothetical protein [Pseudonocardia lacus]|uniref:hypothetical protein n=1 Tax=Pseudonocardia lacus TaxID=2835865 RepID=UPI001BDC0EDC|nr:hypothetical protein [Pseudonocardia lacus]
MNRSAEVAAGPGRESGVDRQVDLLDDVCGVHVEMREIRERHRRGLASPMDQRRYAACWRALALRRSPGRRVQLSREFDVLLAERAWREVEAALARDGEAPASEAGSSVPM